MHLFFPFRALSRTLLLLATLFLVACNNEGENTPTPEASDLQAAIEQEAELGVAGALQVLSELGDDIPEQAPEEMVTIRDLEILNGEWVNGIYYAEVRFQMDLDFLGEQESIPVNSQASFAHTRDGWRLIEGDSSVMFFN